MHTLHACCFSLNACKRSQAVVMLMSCLQKAKRA